MAEEQKNTAPQQPELSELLRLRREKLTALQEAGEDPFQQTRFDWDTTSVTFRTGTAASSCMPVKTRWMKRSIRSSRSLISVILWA